jgi:Sulfite exporter TauE/SafE
MDIATIDLAIFLLATFTASLVAGLAGFAFGLVAAAVWLHILSPLQTASLIIAFGLIVQGVAVWKLRNALQWRRLWPFLLGGMVGVPIGATVLNWANPDFVRAGVGASEADKQRYALHRDLDKYENSRRDGPGSRAAVSVRAAGSPAGSTSAPHPSVSTNEGITRIICAFT